MKILLVHNFYTYRGGEDEYFFALRKLLKDSGHKVIVYTKDSARVKGKINYLKIGISLFYNVSVKKELKKIIEKEKPDIAHFNNIYPLITPTAYSVCKKYNIPVAQTIHNYRLICPSGILFYNGEKCPHMNNGFTLNKLVNKCYRKSYWQSSILSLALFVNKLVGRFKFIDHYIFPSEYSYRLHKKYFKLDSKKSTILPSFFSYTNTYRKYKKESYFLYVGRLSKEKGVIPILDIFSELRDLNLVLIGDGPLKKEILKYNKYKNISVIGFLSHKKIFKYINKALFVIIPSLWVEVMPLVLIESFANGTPVIVPKIGVFKDFVINNKCGLFFRFTDKNSLKKTILNAYYKRHDIEKMNNQIKKQYEKNYKQFRFIESLLEIYKSMQVEKT